MNEQETISIIRLKTIPHTVWTEMASVTTMSLDANMSVGKNKTSFDGEIEAIDVGAKTTALQSKCIPKGGFFNRQFML